MEQPKLLLGRTKVIFTLVCSFAALYMTLTQIVRYAENKDSSSISYKQFNQTPKDKYPTFTICLNGIDIYWPNAMKVFRDFGMSTEQYAKVLKGEEGIRYKYEYAMKLYRKETVNMLKGSSTAFIQHW